MFKKRKVHMSNCCMCGESMYIDQMLVLNAKVLNKGPDKAITPYWERQVCCHFYCLKVVMHKDFLSLMQSEIQNAAIPDKVADL